MGSQTLQIYVKVLHSLTLQLLFWIKSTQVVIMQYSHLGAINQRSWPFIRDSRETLGHLPTKKLWKYLLFVCSHEADGVSPAEKPSPQHLQHLRNAFTALLHSKGDAGNRAKCGIILKEFHQVLKSAIGSLIDQLWVERFINEVSTVKLKLSNDWVQNGWFKANVSTFTRSWITVVPDRWVGRCVFLPTLGIHRERTSLGSQSSSPGLPAADHQTLFLQQGGNSRSDFKSNYSDIVQSICFIE